MKILYATNSTKLSGGTKQMYYNIMGMHDAGHEVHLACPLRAQVKGIATPALDGILELDFKHPAAAGRKLANYMRVHGITHLHTFHTKAHKAGVFAKLRVPSIRFFSNRGVTFMPHNILFFNFPGIAGYTCNSRAARWALRMLLIPQRKINVIYNAFAPDGSDFHVTGPGIDVIPDRFNICTFGSTSRWKGFHDVLNAFSRMESQNAELYVIGACDTSDVDALPSSVKNRVHLLGERRDVPDILERMDVLVLSPIKGESCPNVVLEAFHCGLAVVGSRVGGIPDLVRHGENGLLAPKHAPRKLAKHLDNLEKNRDLTKLFGRRNREVVGFFTLERKIRNLEQIYHGGHIEEAVLHQA